MSSKSILVPQSSTAGRFAKDGLWGIAFGNDEMAVLQPGQPEVDLHPPHNTLFYTAGRTKRPVVSTGAPDRVHAPR